MTTPVPPTGTVTSVPARLVRADGATTLTKTAGAALISAAPANDPPVVVAENIYEDRVPSGTDYRHGPAERILKFRAGQVILTSQWNAAFPAATVDSITPSTGAAAGGTAVTITGSNFSPDATVTIGGNAATGVNVVSPSEIKATTAAHAAGTVDVVVTTDAGTGTKTGGFTFV